MSKTPNSGLDHLLLELRERVNRALHECLPGESEVPSQLHRAMRYAVLNGGKRVRATLVYLAGRAVGASHARLDAPACAVELIHAYSLVHDDLPAMDDDDLRRGKPSCHKAFDEATALLAGDALQSQAFAVLGALGDDALGARMVRVLAEASGSLGMAGGQAIDLEAVGKSLSLAELESMHARKTGALIRASVKLGAIAGRSPPQDVIDSLDDYARCVGLAFQIRDDILDVEGDTQTLGKRQGSDAAKSKPTYPVLMGLDAAKSLALSLHEEAIASLQGLGIEARPLRWLSEYIVTRAS